VGKKFGGYLRLSFVEEGCWVSVLGENVDMGSDLLWGTGGGFTL